MSVRRGTPSASTTAAIEPSCLATSVSITWGRLFEEMAKQQHRVVATVTQWRQCEWSRVQPAIKIGTKAPGFALPQVGVASDRHSGVAHFAASFGRVRYDRGWLGQKERLCETERSIQTGR
jgi:hypothetical protein